MCENVKCILQTNIISNTTLPEKMNELKSLEENYLANKNVSPVTSQLVALSKGSVGFSGRTLRKIPLLARALYLEHSDVSLEEYLQAMTKAVDYQQVQENYLT